MEKRLIDYHREWERKRRIPESGLCTTFGTDLRLSKYRKTLQMFQPREKDKQELYEDMESDVFWAAGLNMFDYHIEDRMRGYTPRRQAIVLLICAMHDEL